MSKESALSMLNGAAPSNPGLVAIASGSAVTGEIPTATDMPASPPAIAGLDSDRFAALSKKEAAIVREKQEWKALLAKEKAEIEDLKAKLRDPYEKIQSFEKLKAQDPVAALKEIGFSETDIFNFMAQSEKTEPTTEELAARVADEKINQYKQEQLKLADEAQKAKDEAILKKFETSIADNIASNTADFEFCNFHGEEAQSLVYKTASAILEKEGAIPPLKEVIALVEQYYEDRHLAMSQLKKLQPKVETEAAKTDQALKAQVSPKNETRTRTVSQAADARLPQPQAKTLTNKIAPTAASLATRKETPDQKRARLIEALRNGAKL